MEGSIEKESFSPLRCTELLRNFEEKEALPMGEELLFSGVDGRDVYNITAPFIISFGGDKKTVIAGRVEAQEEFADSQIMFFEEKEGGWTPVAGAPTFSLEDGFVTSIGNEIIFGGVKTYPKPAEDNPNEVGYRTVFYRGQDLSSLEQFATGPDMMKDIRVVALANGRFGVFTRPQGGSNVEGKIGYVEIDDIEDLNDPQIILGARIIEGQFAPGEWGGVNDLHLLPDGRIEVIGHVAYKDAQGKKHYYAMSFVYDPEKHYASPIEIIATRKNFPEGGAKTPEKEDIVFPGSLVRNEDGTGTLYAGLSDAKAGKTTLPPRSL